MTIDPGAFEFIKKNYSFNSVWNKIGKIHPKINRIFIIRRTLINSH